MRATAELTWVEAKLFLREPVTVVFTLALPPLLLFVMAKVFGNTPDPDGRYYGGYGPMTFYTPAYVALVITSIGLVGLPVHVASYRERGVLRRFRAARMPVRALVVSQLVVTFAAVAVGAVVLVVLAQATYDVGLPASWAATLLAVAVGTVSFAALGVLLGALLPTARAAQGLGVLLWFVMLMVGGGGPPPEVLDDSGLSVVGDLTPTRHLVVAIQDPWLGQGTSWAELGVLTVLLVVAAAGATWLLRRGT